MHEVINFLQGIFTVSSKDATPIGLTSFKVADVVNSKPKRIVKGQEMRLSELMRKPH